ncbi:MAG: right-handed parallel beta-helix repeat-containing protein [Prolixibacteraceae bacterium]|jgi:hypothetical protein|nr:right-handed parallel beta-helix repeat-containing protein [Prolixibacteraceae bacterium]
MIKKRILSSIIVVFAISLLCMHTSAQPSGGPYGPMPQTYEIPENANVVYYVAPEGDENNNGLLLDEPTTIEQAIAKAVTNDAIILRGGTYRIGNLKFNQGITMQPYQNEKPVLKGTYVADKWTKLRTDLWITKWEHFFPSEPQDWWERTRQGMWTPLYKFNDDMVFVDGKFLDVVGWEGDVDEDSYYIDYDNGLVYIGTKPEGKEVEITAFNVALHRITGDINGKESDKKGFNLLGIKLTQYAYRAIEIGGNDPEGISPESEHGKDVVGTTIENCEISFCSRVAGYFRGDGLTMRNNRVSDTSTEGIYILASNDVFLERNIILRNNIENITGYFPSAVKIFNQCYRVTCNDNLVLDHPNSNGIWYDVGNVDGVFTNNWMENVGTAHGKAKPGEIWPAMNGFFFEISKNVICAGNVFVNCNHGLMSLNSSGVRAYNNTFFNSMAVFARSERSAEGDHFGWHPATGPGVEERHSHVFLNNLLVADDDFDQALLTVWQSPVVCERASGTPFDNIGNNVYVRSKSYDYSPLMWWAPASNEKCRMPVSDPSELNDLYAGHGRKSIYLENYGGAVFRSSTLHNFEPLPHFTYVAEQAKIPLDVQKLINRNKEKGVGAYPFIK